MAARLQPIDWAPALAIAAICAAVGVVAAIDPRLAVFAALGLGFVLLTFVDLAAGVVLLTIVVFAETTPVAGPALSFTKLTGLLLALAWFAHLTTQPAARTRLILSAHPYLSYLLAAFLVWAAISTAWADNSAAALVQVSRLILVGLLYVIVYTAVRTPRHAIWVIAGFVTSTAGTAAYGLVVRPEIDSAETARLVSTIEDPNFLAAFLVAGLALSCAAYIASRGSPPLRFASASAAALCFAAFALTGSRGGVIALAVALLASVVVAGRRRAQAVLAAAVVTVCAVAFYTLYAPPEIRERVGGATQGQAQRQESRLTIWTVGWRMVEDNPVYGVGAGNFAHESIHYVVEPGTVYRTDQVIDKPGVVHNTYLGVLAEYGAIGAAMFLAILAFSIACALRAAQTFARHGDWRMEVLTRGLVVAMAGVLAADFFVSAESNKITWLLLALGPALLGVARNEGAALDR